MLYFRPVRVFLSVTLLLTMSAAAFGQTPAQRLAQWKRVEMPFHSEGLSAREKQMVAKLAEACRLLDAVYWRQSDTAGLAQYQSTKDPVLKDLFFIMGSRYDLLDENKPFTGSTPLAPGHELYPHDLTREAAEQYVAKHPEDKAAIYDPFTVVKRRGERLVGIPYREEYKALLEPMAKALREAAALSDDKAFTNYLRLRAAALLTDKYYESDLAWLDLKDPKFDLIFAPYETYLDDLLGVKTSYGASILVRNEEESRKLALYEKYVPQIQESLPLEARFRPSKAGHLTPLEVMDAPFRTGDLLHGYQAVADNLPNDPRVHQAKGTKKIFFKNFMDARVTNVVLPIAKKLMRPDQAAKATAEGYMAATVLHEIAHDLGAEFSKPQGGPNEGKQLPITEAMGPVFSGLEEAKADVVGMYGLAWLMSHGAVPAARQEEFYSSYVAGIFRTLRFGTGEAHGRAEMMEFNYLLEQHALAEEGGRYVIDYQRIPVVLAALAKNLLEMEATGDRARAEARMTKYDRMPAALITALAATTDVPVDVYPVYSFKTDLP